MTPRIMRLRCFVGIPCQLPDAAQLLLEELKRLAQRGIRVVPTANLHNTLKFIGAVDQDQVGFLDSILRNRSSKQAVLNLRCHGIEFLNN
ncbi:MAG: 2'-5' RNA ligase family protein [Gammaproteobacteria bacterium]|nr:2'-5' RNA ligase family protein [Gammaproteobacteria bacterium]MDG2337589.1 2'-5' RNA ligase family protein [Gammaproteobacteria bacterium]